jgi:ubiquinone/menaquinone biosynthesis C-methylase UbiE
MEPEEILDIYSVVSEFYDYVVPYRNRHDVDFFVEMARESGSPVLEVGCGSGRILVPTANIGIEIVGLDLSSSMLSLCREKLSRESEEVRGRVQLVQGDMRDFDIGREFRLVTTPFRPFQHLIAVEDQLACLNSIHKHLVEGGTFILDIFNPHLKWLADEEYINKTEDEPEFTMPDGRKVVRRGRILTRDTVNQRQEVELAHCVTYPDGYEETLTQRFWMRYFFRFEVEHLLARAGFEVENIYSDYDKSSLGEKEPGELIFVARKV